MIKMQGGYGRDLPEQQWKAEECTPRARSPLFFSKGRGDEEEGAKREVDSVQHSDDALRGWRGGHVVVIDDLAAGRHVVRTGEAMGRERVSCECIWIVGDASLVE